MAEIDNMWTLTIVRRVEGNLRFLYHDMALAIAARDAVWRALAANGNGLVTITDDYGNEAVLYVSDISAVCFCDVNRDLEGSAEHSLLQAIAQNKLQRRAQTDRRMNSGVALARPAGSINGFGGNG